MSASKEYHTSKRLLPTSRNAIISDSKPDKSTNYQKQYLIGSPSYTGNVIAIYPVEKSQSKVLWRKGCGGAQL
jgi:hypothetical protein